MRLVLALAASLVLAQPAAAATVTAEHVAGTDRTPTATAVEYRAAAGETNRVTIRATPEEVRFLDEAPVTAGAGCEQAGEREVVCGRIRDGEPVVGVFLGDGDDRAAASGSRVGIIGGKGADELVGGPGDQLLDDGPGADTVSGGEGDDSFLVAAARAGEGPDRLDGGPGEDLLNLFLSGRSGVVADLAAGTARAGGKRFRVAGFERVFGSPGPDRLLGGPAGDRLYGSDGADLVDGRGGDDRLTGGAGRDALRGGPGDDRLELREDEDPEVGDGATPRNRIDCGPGDDEIEILNDLDTVAASCERFAGFRLLADPRRRARVHLVLPPVACSGGGERCREVLRLDTVRGEGLRPRTRLETRRRARRFRLGREARATLRRERARRILVRLARPRASVRFVIRLG